MSLRVVHRPARVTRPVEELDETVLAAPPAIGDAPSGFPLQSLLPIVGSMASMTMMMLLRNNPIMVVIGAVILVVALAVGLYLLIGKTRLGMKIRAGAFNRDMTESLGINIKLIHALVFAIGVALATVAGMIAAPVSSVYPNMGASVLIMCFVVVTIGGIGSVRGALIAALLVGLVDTFGKVLLPQVSSMGVYMLMAAVLLWKPEGLFKS